LADLNLCEHFLRATSFLLEKTSIATSNHGRHLNSDLCFLRTRICSNYQQVVANEWVLRATFETCRGIVAVHGLCIDSLEKHRRNDRLQRPWGISHRVYKNRNVFCRLLILCCSSCKTSIALVEYRQRTCCPYYAEKCHKS
jgi:hypothetical protein